MIAFNDDIDNVGIDEESIIIDDEDNDRIVFDINIDDGSVVDDDNNFFLSRFAILFPKSDSNTTNNRIENKENFKKNPKIKKK